jgi:ABC-type Fe3+-hydroxamate transport system substrate-binding protein
MRVVSLCPSLTETVFRLGRGAMLVGRTKFCVRPGDGVEAIERVGGTKNPRIERIVELAPDLVLMNEEENRREDAEALRARGVAVLSTFARDVAGAVAAIGAVGDALAAGDAAAPLTQAIEARARAVEARAAARRRQRVAYVIWRRPWMIAGRDTYVDALLALAGGDNVAGAGGARYPEVDAATLAGADWLLLASEPFPFAARHVAELVAETGLPAARVALVDGEALSWHGARSYEGLAYADALLAGLAGEAPRGEP